jgi:hypothetical protein
MPSALRIKELRDLNDNVLLDSSKGYIPPSFTSAPSNPSNGTTYFNSNDNLLYVYINNWVVVSGEKGTQNNPFTSAIDAMANNAAEGLHWFKNSANQIQELYYANGYVLVSSNDARSSVIPDGASKNNLAYTLRRNGTLGALGTPDPNQDYIIGSFLDNFLYTKAKCLAWGFGSTDETYSYTNQGTNLIVTFDTSSYTQVVPRSSVTVNGSLSSSAAYFVLDGIAADVGLNANANQSTIGIIGVISSDGDPSPGCYLGHGIAETNHEGWYNSSNSNADCQGYTSWVQ